MTHSAALDADVLRIVAGLCSNGTATATELREKLTKEQFAAVVAINPDEIPDSRPLRNGNVGNRGFELNLIELATRPEPLPRRFRIAGLAPDGAVTLVYGDAGIGKSFLALLMGICIVTGKPFANLGTIKGRVLYVDAELDVDEHTRRAYKLARGLGLDGPPAGLIYANPTYSLATEKGREWLLQAKHESGAEVVLLDSLTYASWGIKLSEGGEVGSVMRGLQQCGTVVAFDHTQWAGAEGNQSEAHPFGSFAKKMGARSMVQMNGSAGGSITLRQNKANFGLLGAPVYVALEHTTDAITLNVLGEADDRMDGADKHMRAEEKVLFYLRQEPKQHPDTLAEKVELSVSRVRNILTALGKRQQAWSHNGLWTAGLEPPSQLVIPEVPNLPMLKERESGIPESELGSRNSHGNVGNVGNADD